MRRMFEDITPEFIRKAERVGVDAKTVKIGLYRGADRIVWYFVKKKLEKKVNAALAEIKSKTLDRVRGKMLEPDFLNGAKRSLGKISDKHDIYSTFSITYDNAFFTLDYSIVTRGAENAGGTCLSVKALAEDDLSVSFEATFYGLDGKMLSKKLKTSDFERLKAILNERIVWGRVENQDALFECLPRKAVEDVGLLFGIAPPDIDRLEALSSGEWTVVLNYDTQMLVGKFMEQGEGLLAFYAMNEKSGLKGKTSLPMIADKLNTEGVANIEHDGHIYLIEPGNDYEHGNDTPGLLTLRSRI